MSDSPQPVRLTVHSTADADTQGVDGIAQTRRGRWTLIALFLACASPVIASYFLFYVVQPQGGNSYGTLVQNLDAKEEIPAVMVELMDGTPTPLRNLRGQWLLISTASGSCPAACQKHLYLQRQMREMLGRDKDRLDWVWLIHDKAPIPAELQNAARAAKTLRIAPQDLASWLRAQEGESLDAHLYLVDPMGNWMMRFPPNLDPKKAVRDIKLLLRASNSWDKAGA